MNREMIESSTSPLNKAWPLWWAYMPPTGQPFRFEGRVAISALAAGAERELVRFQVKPKRAAVVHYEVRSYTWLERSGSVLDGPGALAGRGCWFPQVADSVGINCSTQYPDSNGAIGITVNKHEGLVVLHPQPGLDPCPYLLLPDESNFQIVLKILNPAGGEPIPEGGERFFEATAWGWFVPFPA